jgi:hypothetical protein
VHFLHLAEHTGFEPFLHEADALPAVALIAHHRLHAVLFGGLLQRAHLPDVMRQRLLHKEVLLCLHRGHGGREMDVIRRGDEHRVDLAALLVEHLAEVGELRHLGCFFAISAALRPPSSRQSTSQNATISSSREPLTAPLPI